MVSHNRNADGSVTPWSALPRNVSRADRPAYLILLLAPIVYLSVRHGIHVCLYLLALLAAHDLSRNLAHYREMLAEPWMRLLLAGFAALTLATAITQAINLKPYWPAFDGPSKILVAALILLFLRTRAIAFGRILEVALPLGLFFTFLVVILFPEARATWDGRYATRFADPNSLGSQSLLFSFLCLFSIRLFGKEATWLLLLKVAGITVGLHMAIHTQSRGGWLAIPPLLILWLTLHFATNREAGLRKYILPALLLGGVFVLFVLGYEYSTIISVRSNSAYQDIADWVSGKNLDTPVGIRLSIWKIAADIAQYSPWSGFGESGFRALLPTLPIETSMHGAGVSALMRSGPHSDILAKLLTMGVIGVGAYLATLLLPGAYFWAHRRDTQAGTRGASHLGLCFVVGLFACGLTNEMMSLKYLCSFYGVMIAGLASDVAKRVE